MAHNDSFGGQNRGRGGAMLTPNELVLTWGFVISVPLLAKIDEEMRRESADRQRERERETHAVTEANCIYNVPCYMV